MMIEFKENPYVPGNIQCFKDNRHVASIDKYNGEITWINHSALNCINVITIKLQAGRIVNAKPYRKNYKAR